MSTVFLALAILAMAATLATLGFGLVAMTRGGEFNARYGNVLMRLRVLFQGLAILFFAAALLTRG